MKLKYEDSIVFFGDSITDCSKHNIAGEGCPVDNPYGNGYVSLIYAYLHAIKPELQIRVINKGVGGNRTCDLVNRFDEDVLSLKPKWLSIMIGVNDAWREFDFPNKPSYITTVSQYEKNLESMLVKAFETKINVIILSPFMMELNKDEPMMKKVLQYHQVCRNLALKYNLPFVDIQDAFDKILVNITTHELSRDRVHPNLTGHMLICNEFLKAMNVI